MIWRSVVGKLWLTIIGLVTLVLMLLSLILSEQLERTVNQGEQKYLLNLARHIQESLQDEEETRFRVRVRPVAGHRTV